MKRLLIVLCTVLLFTSARVQATEVNVPEGYQNFIGKTIDLSSCKTDSNCDQDLHDIYTEEYVSNSLTNIIVSSASSGNYFSRTKINEYLNIAPSTEISWNKHYESVMEKYFNNSDIEKPNDKYVYNYMSHGDYNRFIVAVSSKFTNPTSRQNYSLKYLEDLENLENNTISMEQFIHMYGTHIIHGAIEQQTSSLFVSKVSDDLISEDFTSLLDSIDFSKTKIDGNMFEIYQTDEEGYTYLSLYLTEPKTSELTKELLIDIQEQSRSKYALSETQMNPLYYALPEGTSQELYKKFRDYYEGKEFSFERDNIDYVFPNVSINSENLENIQDELPEKNQMQRPIIITSISLVVMIGCIVMLKKR